MRTCCLSLSFLLTTLAATSFADSIWIEGEAAQTKQVSRHGWYDGVKKDVLSGNEWLSHFDANREGLAAYEFEAATAGDYKFWVRANHVKSSLAYRLNGGPWQKIAMDQKLRGAMNIARDNKPDLRFIAWVSAGVVNLEAGRQRLEFRMDSGPQNHGAIDCFCLTTDRWVPSGTLKPSSKSRVAGPSDWFPVVLDEDPLAPESVIDIGYLIEAPAGQHGFLKADADRLRFEKARQPSKFWAINASPGDFTPEQMQRAARWYRKHGINLVRQHTVINAVGLLDRDGKFDSQRLDHYDRWFAALKEQGIYTTWSVIYPHHGPFLQKHDGYDPDLFAELDQSDKQHDGNRQAIVVNDFINLDRDLQDIALRYFERLLNHENPYTGLRYKDDPALAVLEFQNESNLFFHTLNSLRGGERPLFARKMRRAFFGFVKAKYQTEAATARAWNNRWDRDDKWDAGELGLMGAFHWGSDGPLHEFRGQKRRAGDYIEFLTKLQRDYYTRREREVRRIGFQAVTVTTAWKSGGPAASMANLVADDAGGMIDRHNYFGGGAGGHVITEGDVVTKTHLAEPGRGLLSLGLFQVGNKPFGVSEWSMLPPSPYKAEAAPLYAFYGMGLQGWDAVYHFNCNAPDMGDGWPSLRKYVTETPHYLGQFPALAFAVYNGHIKEGDVVASRELGKSDVFAGRDVLGQSLSGGSWDAKELTGRLTTSPATLAIGRVTIGFRRESRTTTSDLTPFHDEAAKSLRSTTNELLWRYGDRCVEVRSDRTQAVIGFTGGERVDLPGVKAKIRTPFVSLIFTPLDNEPLVDSRQILITAMARDKQTGTQFNADWSKLLTVGGPPLLLEPVEATLFLSGSAPTSVKPLDGYGIPTGESVSIASDGSFAIDGRYQTYYYEVKR
ncbi:MAG: hypothetical protein GY903_25610 [Fuerstiella sp.]|nr:hypothetical protein [Fuerstiella sp.]MCP4857875.1 hypothetical protein [Fuerstiella sp.]